MTLLSPTFLFQPCCVVLLYTLLFLSSTIFRLFHLFVFSLSTMSSKTTMSVPFFLILSNRHYLFIYIIVIKMIRYTLPWTERTSALFTLSTHPILYVFAIPTFQKTVLSRHSPGFTTVHQYIASDFSLFLVSFCCKKLLIN